MDDKSAYSLNQSDITEDQYQNGAWIETNAILTEERLQFNFIIDYEYNGEDYVQFKVEYKLH